MMWALGLLFLSAFGAATLLPLQSEAVLVGLLAQTQYPVRLLVAVASLGNILGSCVNWWLFTHLNRFKKKQQALKIKNNFIIIKYI
jgi:membrane protein YqaA with SNARE-associated domain